MVANSPVPSIFTNRYLMKKYLLVVSLIFTFAPLSSALAAVTYTDPFYGITDAINAQTKMFKDALTQQQIAALPASCVQRLRADIAANDTYIRDTEKMIADFNAKNVGKQFTAEEEVSNASTLNHLSTLISVQRQRYTNEIIRICSQERQQQNQQLQQPAVSTGIQCNGKSWGNCPAGTTFSCPASGDPQCLSNQPSKNSATEWSQSAAGKFTALLEAQRAKTPVAPVESVGGSGGSGSMAAPAKQRIAADTEAISTTVAMEAVAGTSSTPKEEESPSYISRIWAWFTGLFGH